MAGTNKILKENEVLFSIGDPADAMYIVRRGSLKVYFPKGNSEVTLAMLKDGAIVGEMAFFDEKPRSASVKAVEAAEVTIISKADFEKLLAQVPKWMVTMMQSLVARLRQTNEKLQALEASHAASASASGTAQKETKGLILANQSFPFQHALRAMQVLILSLAKDGEKEGRDVFVRKEFPERIWKSFFDEPMNTFEKTIAVLESCRLVVRRVDAMKNPGIAFPNRGGFANFVEFFDRVARHLNPLSPFFSAPALAVLEVLTDSLVSSGYDSLNMSLKSLVANNAKKGASLAEWSKGLAELQAFAEIKCVKAADDTTIKLSLKDAKTISGYLKLMKAFFEAGLA